MALITLDFLPGIDKQDTTKGAERRFIDSNNVRFRYGLPEKVGGWSSLLPDKIVGVVRAQHPFTDLDGNRYVALGTDKFLLLYFEGQLFDITPIKSSLTSSTMATTDESTSVTITTSSAHGAKAGDIVQLDSVTLPSGTGLSASNFEDVKFQVITAPSTTTFTITSTAAATATVSTGGSITCKFYEPVGPREQTYGYGWGVGNWGGTIDSAAATTVNEALDASETTITLTSAASFPTAGTILVDSELITYTGKSTNDLTGCTRGALGSTAATHSNGATATNASDFGGWGVAVKADQVQLEPGLWSLDNFGQVLVATVANGKTFTWNAGATTPTANRASTSTSSFSTSNNPTASRATLISPTTRHLIHFGTETTIGTTSTQDDMFIRFGDQEDINTFIPSAINAAGTQRLQDGTKIVGAIKAKETILIWTDTALYTMKFIGAPFTFGFEQVGTNCGLIGKNAAVEIDGVAYWMSNNGFFLFDGTVKSLPCSVEDFVYDDIDLTKGQQITAGVNNLFTEIIWWYPTSGQSFNNRLVAYNYLESMGSQVPGGIWYTSTEGRTSWMDAKIYPKPYATSYTSTDTGTFPTIQGVTGLGATIYFEHEVGNNQINTDGSSTAISSFVQSYDFDLEGQGSEGDRFLSVRRFVPDFKVLEGTAKVTLAVKRFPSQEDSSTGLSPFSITSSTTKKDTRARGRYVNIKIENDDIDQSWRFGTFSLDVQADGGR
tara:strand:+ start:745 stop:2910 length:2166 start_codon:yes stop_codon:yes gene_type:complete